MIEIGQKASISKRFTEEEVAQFSTITMDDNLIHLEEEYAKSTRFGSRIVQGPLLDAMVGGLLGSHLPGPGTIYLSHETQYKKPVYIEELVTVNIEVTHIKENSNIITLKKWVEKEDKTIAMEGIAVVMDLKEQL